MIGLLSLLSPITSLLTMKQNLSMCSTMFNIISISMLRVFNPFCNLQKNSLHFQHQLNPTRPLLVRMILKPQLANINFIPRGGGFIVKMDAFLCQHGDVTTWTLFTQLFALFCIGTKWRGYFCLISVISTCRGL